MKKQIAMETIHFESFDGLFDDAVRHGAIEGLEYPKYPKRCIKYATEKCLCEINFNCWLRENFDLKVSCDENSDVEHVCDYETYLTRENFGKMLKSRYEEEESDKYEAKKRYEARRREYGIIEDENTPLPDNAMSKSEPNTPKKETDNHKQPIKEPQHDKLKDYFLPTFNGMGSCVDCFASMVDDLKMPRTGKEIAQVALMIYESRKLNNRKPNTFSKWYGLFCDRFGFEKKTYKPNDLKPIPENLKKLFSYL